MQPNAMRTNVMRYHTQRNAMLANAMRCDTQVNTIRENEMLANAMRFNACKCNRNIQEIDAGQFAAGLNVGRL